MSTVYYKLTDENGETFNRTKWGVGISHTALGKGKQLCSPDVISIYDSSLKAALFNPIHADFENPRLWECEVDGVVADDGLKVGVKRCTTVNEIPLPIISLAAKVRFAIYVALEVYGEPKYRGWAEGWLSNTDRSDATAGAAAWATGIVRWKKSAAAARDAAAAARDAAREAAWTAAGDVAWTAVNAVAASNDAASKKLDFHSIAERAIADEANLKEEAKNELE